MTEITISKHAEHVFQSHEMIMTLHSKALACSCECLGMMSENQMCALGDNSPTYMARDFRLVMEKWGLINKEGEVRL